MSIINTAHQPRFKTAFALGALALSVLLIGLTINKLVAQESTTVWKRVCSETAQNPSCWMEQQLFLNQKDKEGNDVVAGRILKLTVVFLQQAPDGKSEPYLSLQMPLGVDLRPGAVLRVDQNEEIKLSYLRCTQSGCESSVKLSPELLESLKIGGQMTVGFRPWGHQNTVAVQASLSGFQKVYESFGSS